MESAPLDNVPLEPLEFASYSVQNREVVIPLGEERVVFGVDFLSGALRQVAASAPSSDLRRTADKLCDRLDEESTPAFHWLLSDAASFLQAMGLLPRPDAEPQRAQSESQARMKRELERTLGMTIVRSDHEGEQLVRHYLDELLK